MRARDGFANAVGQKVVEEMIAAIAQNVNALSEIDGAIGDGDHGVNMGRVFRSAGYAWPRAPEASARGS